MPAFDLFIIHLDIFQNFQNGEKILFIHTTHVFFSLMNFKLNLKIGFQKNFEIHSCITQTLNAKSLI